MAAGVAGRIRRRLEAALQPETLDVIDDSHRHAGHLQHPGGADTGGETHFTVRIVSPAFSGLSRLARHRLVNEILAEELAGRVHALAIEARAPGEEFRARRP